ncbi:MAG: SPFH domain-containing protein [Planctomycetota bacterium]|nr:SPFH domain-containing protein [Planctomycetota bacterium]MDA1104986.1 SPFH domain-containing protein [Planctomycetota bacterium]
MTNSPDYPDPAQDAPDQARPASAPRRSASARLTVAGEATDAAELRAAMDPANQSLGEALLLSYRILQLAILGLVVAFLFSGFQTIQDGHTGVRTVFGRVSGEPGEEMVSPGLHPFWPYPIGEMIVFPQRQSVDLRSAYWPQRRSADVTLNQMTEGADITQPLRPSTQFGSLITADGDLAHMQVTAEFAVADPVRFLERFSPGQATAIVRAALQQATVRIAAQTSLDALVEQRTPPSAEIQASAQSFLDDMQCGIQILTVSVPERIAPLAIRNIFRRVQSGREDARTTVEKARQEAVAMLLDAAGPGYDDLLGIIGRYESALTAMNTEQANEVLAELARRLEEPDIGGTAAKVIQRARASQAGLEASLGRDARRVAGLGPSFHENPRQLVRQLWLEALAEVFAGEGTEVFAVPDGMRDVVLRVRSSQDVMQARRDADLERKKREAGMIGMDAAGRFQLGGDLIQIDGPGRRLDKSSNKATGAE